MRLTSLLMVDSIRSELLSLCSIYKAIYPVYSSQIEINKAPSHRILDTLDTYQKTLNNYLLPSS